MDENTKLKFALLFLLVIGLVTIIGITIKIKKNGI